MEVYEQQGRCRISYSDGLQGVGVWMKVSEVKVEEITLNDPSEKHKQTESLEQLKIKLFLRTKSLLITPKREWDRNSGHEHEERHYDIP